jgi:hypothetical protein
MKLYDKDLNFIDVDDKEVALVIPMLKVMKETGTKIFPRDKKKFKLRGKHYTLLGCITGDCYFRED